MDVKNVYREMGYEHDVQSIDSYILSEIKSRNLKSTKEVYEDVVEEMKEAASLEPNAEFDSLIETLAVYARMKTEMRALELKRKLYA